MKGKVTSWNGHFSNGFITGEDGNEYFLHDSEITSGSKKINKGNIVQFDFIDTGDKRPRAVYVRKTGHGPKHPFIKDLDRLYETVSSAVIDEEEKSYRLRDIDMLRAYFSEVEDIEWCPDVRRTFREKGEISRSKSET